LHRADAESNPDTDSEPVAYSDAVANPEPKSDSWSDPYGIADS
jgi:hypothetical protein